MKKYTLISLFILIACGLVTGCSKDDSSDDDRAGGNESVITLNMDGVEYTFDNVGPCTLINGQYIQIVAAAKDISNNDVHLRLTISGTTEGAYDESDAILEIEEYQAGGTAAAVGTSLDIQLTEVTPDLRGTFTAVVMQILTVNPPPVDVINEVIYIKDEDLLRY